MGFFVAAAHFVCHQIVENETMPSLHCQTKLTYIAGAKVFPVLFSNQLSNRKHKNASFLRNDISFNEENAFKLPK